MEAACTGYVMCFTQSNSMNTLELHANLAELALIHFWAQVASKLVVCTICKMSTFVFPLVVKLLRCNTQQTKAANSGDQGQTCLHALSDYDKPAVQMLRPDTLRIC